MRRIRKIVATALTMALLFSLGAAVPVDASRKNRSKLDEPQIPQQTLHGFQVLTSNSCVVRHPAESESLLALLAGILIPKLIDKGMGMVGEAARRASGGEENAVEAIAQTTTYFYATAVESDDENKSRGVKTSLNNDFKCLTWVSGEFGLPEKTDEPPPNPETWESFRKAVDGEGVGTWVNTNKIRSSFGILAAPRLYVETVVKLSADRSAFRLVPTFIYRKGSIDSEGKVKKSDLVLTYTFKAPGTASANAFATGIALLSDVGSYAVLQGKALAGAGSGWMPLLPLGEGSKKQIEEMTALEAQLSSLKGDALSEAVKTITRFANDLKNHGPVNLEMQVREVPDLNKWLKVVADILSENKDEISKAISDGLVTRLDPEKKEEAVETDLKRNLEKKKALELAVLDVVIAEAELAVAKDEIAKAKAERALLEKKFVANEKAIEAGEPQPFDN